MSRKIAVVIPNLKEKYRSAIRETAENLGFDVDFFETEAEAESAKKEAEILFSAIASLCRGAEKLKWMCTSFAGVDPFLAPGAFPAETAVLTNSSGAYGTTIAEHIVMTALMLCRRQPEYTGIVAGKGWARGLIIRSIRGSRITLLGTGDIGQEAVKRLRGFSPASVIGVNRTGWNPEYLFDRVIRQKDLDTVLPETDFLIMSLPATAETNGIMDARRLAMLPEDAFIINVGRGNSLDQKALEALLREGKLGGAALDVFEKEPIPADDTLWDCPRLLITPHVAGNMTLDYTVQLIVEQFLENLELYAAGKPLRRVVDFYNGY